MRTTHHELLQRLSLVRAAVRIALTLAIYAFVIPVGLAQSPSPSPSTVYVRKNASSPAAQADLAALDQAMGKMKALPCSNTTSWYYQAGIHWVPDDGTDGSKLQNGNPFCNTYNGTSAQLKAAWDNCTHRKGVELHFLIWHRLYIYYLEDIVRAISGKTDFALPYWNYVDKKDALMPAIFAKKTSNLYEEGRCTVLNKGKPIENKEYGPGKDLDITKLMKLTTYSIFNHTMDNAPHGAMHDYIGGATDEEVLFDRIYQVTLKDENGVGQGSVMSQVPSAAFDPIFWVHHAEIDYIWQQWMNSPKGQLPNLDALKAAPFPYAFFDRNGNPVTLTVEQAYTMAFSLPVTYDTMLTPTPTPTPSASKAKGPKPAPAAPPAEPAATQPMTVTQKAQESAEAPKEVAHSATPQVVKGRQSTISLKLETKANLNEMAAPESDRRVVLHLVVSFTKEPKGSYHVYLQSGGGKQKFIGHMTFFGAAHHARHQAANAGDHDHKLTKSFQFDVTEELDRKAFNGNLNLVIKKDGDPKEADELTIEEQSIKVH